MRKIQHIFLLALALCLFINAQANINQTIQSKINHFLKKHKGSEHFTAVQVAILSPNTYQIKTYVAGYVGNTNKKRLTANDLLQ